MSRIALLSCALQASHGMSSGAWPSTNGGTCPEQRKIHSASYGTYCIPTPWAAGSYAKFSCSDDESKFYVNYWTNDGCDGKPAYASPYVTGSCISYPAGRGHNMVARCNKTAIDLDEYTLAPPDPTGLRCNKLVSNIAGELSLTVDVDAAETDEVAFGISESYAKGPPSLTYTVPVGTSNAIDGVVPGLRPGVQYDVYVRALRKGQEEGYPAAWTAYADSTAVKCTASSTATKQVATIAATPATVNTRWIEMFRLAPDTDFLDGHNTWDFLALGTNLGQMIQDNDTGKYVFSRYCVEIEDVQLPGIITSDVEGRPAYSHFSDYQSCDKGRCRCMNIIDRTWTRRPKANIFEQCHAEYIDGVHNGECNCTPEAESTSAQYVGRAPVPLPVYMRFDIENLKEFPADYTRPTLSSPMGYLYSMPPGSKCKPTARVGDDGCTWSRHPAAYAISPSYDDLVKLGANKAGSPGFGKGEWTIPLQASLDNIAVFGKMWESFMPLDMPPCGTAAGEGHGERRPPIVV